MHQSIRFSITDLGSGGAEQILINILKSLSREKYKLSLFLFERRGFYLNDVPKDVEVKYFIDPSKLPKFLIPFYDRILRRILFRLVMHFPTLVYKIARVKEVDVDVAFLQDVTYLLKANYAKTKIAWLHVDIAQISTFKKLLRKNFEYADKIVGVSYDVSKGLVRDFPECLEKSITILNPSSVEDIQNLAKLGDIVFSKPTIIAVGKLKYQKGFDVLIRSFKTLVTKGYDWELKILGDSVHDVDLPALISELNLEDKVELLGFKKNPYMYMSRANVFVLSSRWEGFGQVVVEALCVGVPVVSTDCKSGPREICKNEECGVLVPVEDIGALADAIELVVNDSSLRQKLISSGLKRCQDFNLQIIIQKIEALFDQSIKR